MRRWICTLLAAVLLPIFFSPTVLAQESTERGGSPGAFGLRAGFGLDPDQFVVGGQFTLPNRFGPMRIVPSVDLGFGSDITTILFNADLIFSLNVEDTRFRLYGGGGPTVAYLDHSESGSSWEVGLYLVAGTGVPLLKRQTTNVEFRFGITDNIPDIRILLVLGF